METICTKCGASWVCEHQVEESALPSEPAQADAPAPLLPVQASIEAIERLEQSRNDPANLAIQAGQGFLDTPWIGLEEPF